MSCENKEDKDYSEKIKALTPRDRIIVGFRIMECLDKEIAFISRQDLARAMIEILPGIFKEIDFRHHLNVLIQNEAMVKGTRSDSRGYVRYALTKKAIKKIENNPELLEIVQKIVFEKRAEFKDGSDEKEDKNNKARVDEHIEGETKKEEDVQLVAGTVLNSKFVVGLYNDLICFITEYAKLRKSSDYEIKNELKKYFDEGHSLLIKNIEFQSVRIENRIGRIENYIDSFAPEFEELRKEVKNIADELKKIKEAEEENKKSREEFIKMLKETGG